MATETELKLAVSPAAFDLLTASIAARVRREGSERRLRDASQANPGPAAQ